MKTILGTALTVCTLMLAFLVQGIADPPDEPVTATPTVPEQWNIWGSTTIDGVDISLRAVECDRDFEVATVCVELVASNPTAELKHFPVNVNLLNDVSSPMSRVALPPVLINAQNVLIQAAPRDTTTIPLFFEVDGYDGARLQLSVLDPSVEVEDWAPYGTVLAMFDGRSLEEQLGYVMVE